MVIIVPGTIFDLRNFRSGKTQRIVFTHKGADGNYVEGTTNEEVLEMLIERLIHFQKEGGYDPKNQLAIESLKTAKQALKRRSKRKKNKFHGNTDKNG